MIIAHAIFLLISTSLTGDAFNNYKELSQQLDRKVEWMDHNGRLTLSRSDAIRLLDELTFNLNNPVFSNRHSSKWNNKQCFRIIHIDSDEKGYRVFFQCQKRRDGQPVVTKIKIREI